jgi:hypothetical protein
MRVNHDFFETLGIKMFLGHSFAPEDDRKFSKLNFSASRASSEQSSSASRAY